MTEADLTTDLLEAVFKAETDVQNLKETNRELLKRVVDLMLENKDLKKRINLLVVDENEGEE